MSLQRLMTDDVFFENDRGERSGPYKTKFGGSGITVFNDKLVVHEGDVVIQPLPNGTEERFVITETKFSSGLGSIKPHFSIGLIKESKHHREERKVANTTFHINNSNVQVGDGNIQNIVNSFERLVQEIDNHSSTPEQKKEAKGLLKSLISNPIVAAVLGGAASGLIELMK